jgi:transposase-like protein
MFKPLKGSKISRYRLLKVIACFCLDIEASKAAFLVQLNRNTINRLYGIFRRLIFFHRQSQKRLLGGIVESDETYFGPARIRGRLGPRKRGRGTFKQPVFGIFERHGEVYTEIVPDCSSWALQRVIRGKVDPASMVMTDGWRGYDGLVDVGYDRHVRINKSKAFAQGRAHINGIEAFWSFTKRRLAKFNGVKKHFALHLKECEWRYGQDLPTLKSHLLKLIRQPPPKPPIC